MDRIVHNAIWVETGGHDMREHTAGQVTAQAVERAGAAGPRPRDCVAPKAIPVAPEDNIHWPPNPQILTNSPPTA